MVLPLWPIPGNFNTTQPAETGRGAPVNAGLGRRLQSFFGG